MMPNIVALMNVARNKSTANLPVPRVQGQAYVGVITVFSPIWSALLSAAAARWVRDQGQGYEWSTELFLL